MNKKSLFYITLFFLMAGCKKENNSAAFTFSDLPFKQGNSWTYSRYDSTVHVRDTVTITIPTIYTRNDSTTYLWVQTAAGVSDTAFWILYKDTMQGVDPNAAIRPIALFLEIIFPFTNGSTWHYNEALCTVNKQLEINNTNYQNVYQVNWQPNAIQDFPTFENIYFVKGIGIVRYNQNTSPAAYAISNLQSTNYQWDLLGYHLN